MYDLSRSHLPSSPTFWYDLRSHEPLMNGRHSECNHSLRPNVVDPTRPDYDSRLVVARAFTTPCSNNGDTAGWSPRRRRHRNKAIARRQSPRTTHCLSADECRQRHCHCDSFARLDGLHFHLSDCYLIRRSVSILGVIGGDHLPNRPRTHLIPTKISRNVNLACSLW